MTPLCHQQSGTVLLLVGHVRRARERPRRRGPDGGGGRRDHGRRRRLGFEGRTPTRGLHARAHEARTARTLSRGILAGGRGDRRPATQLARSTCASRRPAQGPRPRRLPRGRFREHGVDGALGDPVPPAPVGLGLQIPAVDHLPDAPVRHLEDAGGLAGGVGVLLHGLPAKKVANRMLRRRVSARPRPPNPAARSPRAARAAWGPG